MLQEKYLSKNLLRRRQNEYAYNNRRELSGHQRFPSYNILETVEDNSAEFSQQLLMNKFVSITFLRSVVNDL